MTNAAEQESYLPPEVPPRYINPPTGAVFANATWLTADDHLYRLIAGMINEWDEFRELRPLDFTVVWRRRSAPLRGEEPVFATAAIVPERWVWQAYQEGDEHFPRFAVDLHWQHFDDLRRGKRPGEREADIPEGGRAAEYVHEDVLARHVHHALSALTVTNDILRTAPVDFSGYAATVKRFGEWNDGIALVRRQLAFWPSREEG